ncbi:Crp/Fnr family transcriptional regulator [Lutibacter sp. B2]|nr:Crp/Fnr family transcriptional regulator [Lutibacter sp. B2]
MDEPYATKIIDLFPHDCIEEWMNNGKEITFKKGELITTAGKLTKDVYLIKKGDAHVFHIHADGKECVIGLLSSGDFIELLDIFTEKESNLFTKALTEVTVVAISKEKVRKIVEKTSSLAMALLDHFSYRLQEMAEILMHVAYGKVEERLVFLLKKLVDPYKEEDGWGPIPAYITHKDMAGMVASTRETVTVLINKLIQVGVIRQYKNKIWIRLKEKK